MNRPNSIRKYCLNSVKVSILESGLFEITLIRHHIFTMNFNNEIIFFTFFIKSVFIKSYFIIVYTILYYNIINSVATLIIFTAMRESRNVSRILHIKETNTTTIRKLHTQL